MTIDHDHPVLRPSGRFLRALWPMVNNERVRCVFADVLAEAGAVGAAVRRVVVTVRSVRGWDTETFTAYAVGPGGAPRDMGTVIGADSPVGGGRVGVLDIGGDDDLDAVTELVLVQSGAEDADVEIIVELYAAR